MKALKLFAVLGTIAFAAATVPVLAWEEGSAPEADRGGVRLDQLIDYFVKQSKQQTADDTKAVKAPGTALASAKKPPSAPGHKKQPIIKTASAGKKQSAGTQLAVYKNDPQSGVITAVAHVADSATSVIEATLDHPKSKDGAAHYKPGESMVIRLTPKRDCNVIVFDYSGDGTLTQIFPNTFATNGTLHQGQVYELGSADCGYSLDISGKGEERIFVYAYPTSEGQITVAMNAVPNTPFRATKLSRDQYDKMLAQSRGYDFNEVSQQQTGVARAVTVHKRTEVGSTGGAPATDVAPNKLQLVFKID